MSSRVELVKENISVVKTRNERSEKIYLIRKIKIQIVKSRSDI